MKCGDWIPDAAVRDLIVQTSKYAARHVSAWPVESDIHHDRETGEAPQYATGAHHEFVGWQFFMITFRDCRWPAMLNGETESRYWSPRMTTPLWNRASLALATLRHYAAMTAALVVA